MTEKHLKYANATRPAGANKEFYDVLVTSHLNSNGWILKREAFATKHVCKNESGKQNTIYFVQPKATTTSTTAVQLRVYFNGTRVLKGEVVNQHVLNTHKQILTV